MRGVGGGAALSWVSVTCAVVRGMSMTTVPVLDVHRVGVYTLVVYVCMCVYCGCACSNVPSDL